MDKWITTKNGKRIKVSNVHKDSVIQKLQTEEET